MLRRASREARHEESQAAGASRSRPRPPDVRGDGQDGLDGDEPRVQGAVPGPGRDRGPDAPRHGRGRRGGRGDQAGRREALRRGRVPEIPRRRQPRGDLGGRAAAPAVRGVRPRRPDLRDHHRGDRLQDGRHAIRPARARVREAALGVVLAHRDVRRMPDVHAHHPVSEVHELPDERVLSDVPALRPALLRGSVLPLHLLLRLGEIPSPGAPWPRGSASTSSARRSCSSPMPG